MKRKERGKKQLKCIYHLEFFPSTFKIKNKKYQSSSSLKKKISKLVLKTIVRERF